MDNIEGEIIEKIIEEKTYIKKLTKRQLERGLVILKAPPPKINKCVNKFVITFD